MSEPEAWQKPCPHNGPAHNFTPLLDGKERYIGNRLIRAICSKCGVYR